MKNHIATTTIFLNVENKFDDEIRWEFLKYEIRKSSIYFFVSEAKKRNKEMNTLENKTFEGNLTNNEGNEDYLKSKRDLNYIYDQKIEGIKIRTNCNWYEDGEKSSEFFLNLEKNRAIQNQIRLLSNRRKGNKRSKQNIAKFVSVL